jgi:hypothetical protein
MGPPRREGCTIPARPRDVDACRGDDLSDDAILAREEEREAAAHAVLDGGVRTADELAALMRERPRGA